MARGSWCAAGGSRRPRARPARDYDTALACYHSPEYQAAKAKRDGRAVGDVVVIEGYDGPQPG